MREAGMIGSQELQHIPEQERNYEALIAQAKSFNELAEIIERESITLEGSQIEYDPDTLIDLVYKIRFREEQPVMATRAGGFRKKLLELLQSESDPNALRTAHESVNKELAMRQSTPAENRPASENAHIEKLIETKSRLEEAIAEVEERLARNDDAELKSD